MIPAHSEKPTPTPIHSISAPAAQMPAVIAKAILMAIEKVDAAATTGQGEDMDAARKFKYSTINDVLKSAHSALKDAGLTALPIEVEYRPEAVTVGVMTQIWAHYGYRFRLIHKDGQSWVDENDTRHVSIPMSPDGMIAGKAQSLALRDYLKGLLRIQTVEPEDVNAVNVSRETSPKETKGSIPFEFGDGMVPLLPEQIKQSFDKEVAKLKISQRKQWEEVNTHGLRQLHEAAKPIWLHIRKGIDA